MREMNAKREEGILFISPLVDLLDAWAILTGTGEATRSTAAARETARTTREASCTTRETSFPTSSAVQFLHDGVGNALELLLLVFVLFLRSLLRAVEPRDGVIDGRLEFRLVSGVELARKLLVVQRVTEVVCV